MSEVLGGLLGKCAEIKRAEQFKNIVQKQEKSQADIQFIIKYIDNTFQKEQLQKLTGQFEFTEYNNILEKLECQTLKENQNLYENSISCNDFDLLFVAYGNVKVVYGHQEQQLNDFKKFQNGEIILLDQQFTECILGKIEDINNVYFNLIAQNECLIARVNRRFFNDIYNKSLEKFEQHFKEKINSLKQVFPNLKKLDQATQMIKSKFFQPYCQQTYGTVISTTTSGSNDLFLIAKGKILIWVPKAKINNDYSKDFIILGQISNNQIFNETNALFNKECIYGAIIVTKNDENEIYQIKKENIAQISENLDLLKANCEIKERMYKNHIKRYQGYKLEKLEEKQIELCQKYKLDFNEIFEIFKKSSKNKKIVTHNIINKQDYNKNMEQFNQIVKNSNFKSTEMQGDREDIASTVTPRLVSKGIRQMDSAAQISLLALRSIGKDLREGFLLLINFYFIYIFQVIEELIKKFLMLMLKNCFKNKQKQKKRICKMKDF
ncbi:hypothetical protein IMG5_002430 [Ichthyophthirius multifiliis]|uniref:Cyclic nucleotide-binding domain-containing protein n=1 Tax=Ichthyophthirius multifiliis TaxID=5932 RepID=G0QJ47_ICHMU|nr:hypothetical protein IMG5_002430 [Ichthyophthirius multifiliis]EGR34771.1 hypothetical protein IMG5_002430 [Ichthyophthirius multifiliis]|eukprot:XP_004040075.1 hypothetical protein IMG5_002430 [Ichthyophthirius multifiliis]